MKKPGLLLCLLLVFICAAALADVEINETNFPDAAFRGFLLDKTTYTVNGTSRRRSSRNRRSRPRSRQPFP